MEPGGAHSPCAALDPDETFVPTLTSCRGEDLVRAESFGALYYSRARCTFTPLPPRLASLLLGARHRDVLEVWADCPADRRLPEAELLPTIAAWRSSGWLDEEMLCTARFVDRNGFRRALSAPLVTHLCMTSACNLRCNHCFAQVTSEPAADEISLAEARTLFAELDRLGSPVLVLAGGEPMARRDFWDVLDAAIAHRLDTWLCTNGTLIGPGEADRLARAGLRGISVSLDGADRESHDAIRGAGRFDQACSGVRALTERRAPDVQLRVTVSRRNVGSLPAFASIARDLGVHRVVFKPFRMTGAASGRRELVLDRAEYLRAVEEASRSWPPDAPPPDFGDGNPQRPPAWTGIIPAFGCIGGTTAATVTSSATVVACGSVLDPRDWSLREHSFLECWQSSPTIESWRTLEGNAECKACNSLPTCGGACRARALAEGLTMNDPDPWSHCSLADFDTLFRSARLKIVPT